MSINKLSAIFKEGYTLGKYMEMILLFKSVKETEVYLVPSSYSITKNIKWMLQLINFDLLKSS